MKKFLLAVILTTTLACTEQTKQLNNQHYSDITEISKYTELDFKEHSHLKDIKIFIDPGHGGYGEKDIFRTSPSGKITEEAVNLKVSLILAEMLNKCGANVKLSRDKDIMLGLDERIKMVKEFQPQLLLSVHHNGSLRSIDNINYPCILFWGNKDNNPASYDFSQILISNMSNTMGIKGHIISDYTTFWESGARLLRKTRNICPGALGEFGFFSDREYEKKLQDYDFNIKQAEAYLLSISEYFKKGIPEATVYLTTHKKLVNKRFHFLTKRETGIYIKVNSNTDKKGIADNSLQVTINRRPVKTKKVSDDTYKVMFGNNLTPGGYYIQFSFRNRNGQSSMLYKSAFSVGLEKNEFEKLLKKSIQQIDNGNFEAGLKVLLPIYRYCTHEPDGDKVAYYIAYAFENLGDLENAGYYYSKVYHFYPQSIYRNRIKHSYITDSRFRIDNYGKVAPLKYLSSERKIIRDTIE